MATKASYPLGRKEATVFAALYHFNKEQRKAVLQKADTKLVRHICECALNVFLPKLVSPDSTLQRRKNIIAQRGGFLPTLLAPLISTLLANLVNK